MSRSASTSSLNANDSQTKSTAAVGAIATAGAGAAALGASAAVSAGAALVGAASVALGVGASTIGGKRGRRRYIEPLLKDSTFCSAMNMDST